MAGKNIEFLKQFLGDDLYAQVEAKLANASGLTLVNTADGSYVPKGKLDDEIARRKEKEAEITTMTATVTDLQGQIKTFEGKNGDVAALNAKLSDLQGKIAGHTKELEDRDARYASLELRQDVKDALRSKRAKDPELLMAALDMTKVAKKDGKLVGLDEQVEARVKSNPYLFESAPGANGGFASGQQAGVGDALNQTVNNAIRQAAGRG